MFGIGWPDYSLKLYCKCHGNYSVLAAFRLPLEFGCSLCSKPHEMNSPCMFRSSQLFAGTSLTLFFRIFAASIIDSAVSILYKILFNANNFNPHKRPIFCWIWPPAPRVCSEHGGQEQALKLSLNPIDIELSAIVSHGVMDRPCEVIHHWLVRWLSEPSANCLYRKCWYHMKTYMK